MDTQPSRPVTREKPIPVTNRRRVGVFIIAGLIGLALGIIGGIVMGFIVLLIGNSSIAPGLGLELIALFLWPIMAFPIAGLCTGLVTAAQRSVERGSVVGALIFGGSQLALSVSSFIEQLWMVAVPVIVVAVVIGALIGVMCAALSLGFSAR